MLLLTATFSCLHKLSERRDIGVRGFRVCNASNYDAKTPKRKRERERERGGEITQQRQ